MVAKDSAFSPLIVIPARGGSKGIPKKNIALLAGRPLIQYSIDSARRFFPGAPICVSTDCMEIRSVVESLGIEVPFMRPAELATDSSGDYPVMLHALEYYQTVRVFSPNVIVKWQPTSPFRRQQDIDSARDCYRDDVDMVVSVCEAKANPYFTLFEEDASGYLHPSKSHPGVIRRQDAPAVYQYNGSLYFIRPESLTEWDDYRSFPRIRKILMPQEYSIDIDTPLDLLIAETMLARGIVSVDCV